MNARAFMFAVERRLLTERDQQLSDATDLEALPDPRPRGGDMRSPAARREAAQMKKERERASERRQAELATRRARVAALRATGAYFHVIALELGITEREARYADRLNTQAKTVLA